MLPNVQATTSVARTMREALSVAWQDKAGNGVNTIN